MRCAVLVFAVAFCWFGFWSEAETLSEPSDYTTRLWQMEDGLPHNIVQAIAQAQDGYLWVGTREGLARFDGFRFQALELLPGQPAVSVSSLCQGRDGSLWVGTDRSGLFRLLAGTIQRCPAPNGALDFDVREITEGGDGAIWFVCSGEIRRWANGRMEQRAKLRRLQAGLCADTNGGVWTTDGALMRLDAPAGTNGLPRLGTFPFTARSLYCDSGGTFWIGLDGSLLRLENGVTTTFEKGDGPSGYMSEILRDSSGVLWVGSYSGLSRLLNGAFVSQGEAYRIYALFEDRERNLWVGSEEGLSCLTPKLFKTLTKKEGLSLNTVVSVCASRDGSVWISTWGGGLNHWVEGQITVLTKTNGLSSPFIMAMTEGRDGSLWAGADHHGALNRIKDGQILTYGRKEGFDADSSPATTALYEEAPGVLWIGSRQLLHCWDGNRFSQFTLDNGPNRKAIINALCGGTNGEIWIGTDGGLSRRREGRFENLAAIHPKLRVPILSLYQDPQGSLWIGTKGNGLLQWNNGLVREFTTAQGLFSDAIYSVLEDERANLWLNSSRGIFRLAKKQLEAVATGQATTVVSFSYGKADGILSSGQYHEVTQPAACKSADGRLWFRTTQGVAVVNPKEIIPNELPPPVVIEQVVADKRPVGNSAPAMPVEKSLVIQPGRGELEIHYNALSFRAPEKNRFRYKLEGVDLNWVEAGIRRVALYNNLRPGHYRFQVTACNNDGVWSSAGAGIELRLRPHVWQTWWFLSLSALTAVATVGGSARYITRQRLQRKLERLEHQHAIEKERTRIARDMHDELGAKLTRISFQGDTARRCAANPPETNRHIARISETARELILSLDQLVWAVDPQNDSLENLANYICRYVSDFAADSPIDCKFKIPRQLPDCRLSTDVRHNLFLAVKESVNNAFKHSGASQLTLTISVREAEFEICIADNGRGIDSEADETRKSSRTGRGLTNLRERMTSIHGSFELQSEPGQGTAVRLSVPLPQELGRPPYLYPNRTS